MHAQQLPRQRIGAARHAHDHGGTTGAAVGAGVGQEVPLALETHTKRRRDHRLAHDRQVVHRVVKTQRVTHDQQHTAHLHVVQRILQVVGGETLQHGGGGQGAAVDFDHRHINVTGRVPALAPDGFAVHIQPDRQRAGAGEVDRIGV